MDTLVTDPNIIMVGNIFNDEELERIVSQMQGQPLQEAMVSGVREPRVDYDYRVCKNFKVPGDSDEFKWIYDRVFENAGKINQQHWKFDLQPKLTEMEYNEYDAENGAHFGWHSDKHDAGPRSKRRITMVIQLSRPEDYAGGELQLRTISGEPVVFSKERGATILFTGEVDHRVTMLAKGKRKSLVSWLNID
jgi:PKHD-type hydroxylase